eukprot:932185-Amphidinium_carterae.1
MVKSSRQHDIPNARPSQNVQDFGKARQGSQVDISIPLTHWDSTAEHGLSCSVVESVSNSGITAQLTNIAGVSRNTTSKELQETALPDVASCHCHGGCCSTQGSTCCV